MDPIKEFGTFEGKAYSASTCRVYLSAARKALKLLGIVPDKCGSCEELSCLLREALANETLPKTLRRENKVNPRNFFAEVKWRIDPVGNPTRQDPCFQLLLT